MNSKELLKNLKAKVIDLEKDFSKKAGTDCSIILEMYGIKHKAELMFGFDVFTIKEDGTVDNTENDTKHYYIEVWNNFNDEEGYRLGDGSPVATFWLEELDMPIEDILLKALPIMADVTDGKYDEAQEEEENEKQRENAQN